MICGLAAIGALALVTTARAETTPPQPTAAQPTLPDGAQAPSKPGSPVVEKLVESRQPLLNVRKHASAPVRSHHRRVARVRHRGAPRELDRPALAGVQLVVPLPPPDEPPRVTVPLPAFPLESAAAAFTTPPPPIVCHPTRRDPREPDPHLYKEGPVECAPDNP